MSWTKKQFVEKALGKLGLAAYVYDLQPEQEESVLQDLDSMMAEWNIGGVRIGYPLPSTQSSSNLDQDTNVPDWANRGIYLNLAILIGPDFGKVVGPELKAEALRAKNLIVAKAGSPIQERLLPSVPLGAGNKSWRINRQFTPQPCDPITTGEDGVLNLDNH